MGEVIAIYYWLHVVLPPKDQARVAPSEYRGDRYMQTRPQPGPEAFSIRTIPIKPCNCKEEDPK